MSPKFFPSIDPFAGSRARAHPTADILGNSYTTFYNTYVDTFNATYLDYFVTNPWPAPVYLDAATGENFITWPEYFGPTQDRLDFFTTIVRTFILDLSIVLIQVTSNVTTSQTSFSTNRMPTKSSSAMPTAP